jgi:hypothetical protein
MQGPIEPSLGLISAWPDVAGNSDFAFQKFPMPRQHRVLLHSAAACERLTRAAHLGACRIQSGWTALSSWQQPCCAGHRNLECDRTTDRQTEP